VALRPAVPAVPGRLLLALGGLALAALIRHSSKLFLELVIVPVAHSGCRGQVRYIARRARLMLSSGRLGLHQPTYHDRQLQAGFRGVTTEAVHI
jgi:hypothetical protein